ncbi:DUF6285 domain-containing protein [Henriciella algicola]|uniref:DUF6285 domain-containing protein n=1 Tax=Henriciella algicola TaxID=1608422 RepID=A0A399REQ8_9PROT|nr:DUF6285 domain-containing protein [Henriciella algicola]RIJ29011.1 hypothetical protein D1222_11640 [Henriciella algicola]
MHDQPSVSELVQAVKNFVDHSAMPELKGRAAFHARVASNVLATILRDLEAREGNDAAEYERLKALLPGSDGKSREALNEELRDKIRSGELTVASAALMDHLKKTAIAQLKVDQPKYSGLATALED